MRMGVTELAVLGSCVFVAIAISIGVLGLIWWQWGPR